MHKLLDCFWKFKRSREIFKHDIQTKLTKFKVSITQKFKNHVFKNKNLAQICLIKFIKKRQFYNGGKIICYSKIETLSKCRVLCHDVECKLNIKLVIRNRVELSAYMYKPVTILHRSTSWWCTSISASTLDIYHY